MVIVYVTAGLPFGYAGEEFFIAEVLCLQRKGHRVVVVPRNRRGGICSGAQELLPLTRGASLFSPHVLISALSEFIARPRAACLAVRQLVRGASVRSVVKNLAVLPKGFWLARLAKQEGADHIHAQWATTTSSMALVAHTVSGIPWSFTAHRGDIVDNNVLAEKVRAAAFARFISRQGMQMAEALCGDSLSGKAVVIHMGVDIPAQLAANRTTKKTPVVLCPANLILVKGHTYLIKAMGILKRRNIRCQLWLAGRGPLRGALEREVDECEVSDRVRFLGQLPHHELLNLYREDEIDVVVLPSVDLGDGIHEGIPVSLMEAMAHGIPVVSTRTGAIPELVIEEAGILVPPEDPVVLADTIGMIVGDEELRSRLSEGGRRRVELHFNAESSAEQFLRRVKEVPVRSRQA